MNKKIVLVTPPYERVSANFEYVRHITNASPSLGLLHLAASVREHGYEPSIIESDISNFSVDEVANEIIARDPAYLGITLFTVGVWCASEIARKIKFKAPHIKIIVGGPHISSMGDETMERFPEFDVAVVGEGEDPLVELLDAFENGRPLETVPSVIYLDRSDILPKVKKTPKLAIDKKMDRLPMPAWDLLPNFPKGYRPAVYDFPRSPVASIAASRGCPFHCKFCDTSTFGAAVRAYSPQRVFEIMQHLQKEYGIKHILFVDDLFTASRKRTMELCELIIENKMDMTWSCASRVDVVKEDLLAMMKKAGCWEISFGLESGSNELLQKMDKSAAIERSVQALQWTHDAGIRSKGLFMLGYPGETLETIEHTKKFVRDNPLTIMHLTKFTPYPGSPIYRDIYGTNIRDDHWEKMNGMNFVWESDNLTIEELDKNYIEILKSFYVRPKIHWYYTKFTLKHPAHFFRLLKFLYLMVSVKVKGKLSKSEPEAHVQHEL